MGRPVAAIVIMAAIIGTLMVLCTPRTTSRSSAIAQLDWPASPRPAAESLAVRVLVLDFDPALPRRAGRRAHAAFEWNDPRALTAEYVADVERASGGYVRYRIVEWRTLDAFPRKRDGFRYTPDTFEGCWANRETCHEPDGLDYPAMLRDHAVVREVDDGSVDELWIFGGPYFGFFESAMAGPGAFAINGDAFPDVPARRAFAIMGFNYERGVAEMLHNLCHRIEATMSRVSGGWQAESLTTSWARFAANAHQSGGRAGVGSCHYPPNGSADYDYENARSVDSDADDWYAYPRLTGARRSVTRETWGGPDYHRNYMRWWLSHLPRGSGEGDDGRRNNWWEYVFRFNELVIR